MGISGLRRTVVGLGAGGTILVGVLLAGCGDASEASPDAEPTASGEVETTSGTATAPAVEATVEVRGFLFQPDAIEVPAGTLVTWENSDRILHTATAGEPDVPSGLFDGQMQGAGSSFSYSFETPGRFLFFCTRHLHMRGEVLVR